MHGKRNVVMQGTVHEGSGETSQKETSTCDICQFGAECDEDAEDVWFSSCFLFLMENIKAVENGQIFSTERKNIATKDSSVIDIYLYIRNSYAFKRVLKVHMIYQIIIDEEYP
ncbi:hypothetical protein MJT46_004148 [Ovis ammon polii x Ovis aries]|nr:hypothetical protein MJT46_004148 [Ovis ammon polii x Ovis aries]